MWRLAWRAGSGAFFFEFGGEELLVVLVLVVLDLPEVDDCAALGVEVVGLLFLGEVGPLFVDGRDQVVMTAGAEDVLGCWSLAPCLLEREH